MDILIEDLLSSIKSNNFENKLIKTISIDNKEVNFSNNIDEVKLNLNKILSEKLNIKEKSNLVESLREVSFKVELETNYNKNFNYEIIWNNNLEEISLAKDEVITLDNREYNNLTINGNEYGKIVLGKNLTVNGNLDIQLLKGEIINSSSVLGNININANKFTENKSDNNLIVNNNDITLEIEENVEPKSILLNSNAVLISKKPLNVNISKNRSLKVKSSSDILSSQVKSYIGNNDTIEVKEEKYSEELLKEIDEINKITIDKHIKQTAITCNEQAKEKGFKVEYKYDDETKIYSIIFDKEENSRKIYSMLSKSTIGTGLATGLINPLTLGKKGTEEIPDTLESIIISDINNCSNIQKKSKEELKIISSFKDKYEIYSILDANNKKISLFSTVGVLVNNNLNITYNFKLSDGSLYQERVIFKFKNK